MCGDDLDTFGRNWMTNSLELGDPCAGSYGIVDGGELPFPSLRRRVSRTAGRYRVGDDQNTRRISGQRELDWPHD